MTQEERLSFSEKLAKSSTQAIIFSLIVVLFGIGYVWNSISYIVEGQTINGRVSGKTAKLTSSGADFIIEYSLADGIVKRYYSRGNDYGAELLVKPNGSVIGKNFFDMWFYQFAILIIGSVMLIFGLKGRALKRRLIEERGDNWLSVRSANKDPEQESLDNAAQSVQIAAKKIGEITVYLLIAMAIAYLIFS